MDTTRRPDGRDRARCQRGEGAPDRRFSERAAHRRHAGEGRPAAAAQGAAGQPARPRRRPWTAVEALRAYDAALDANGTPTPYRLRDQLRLLESLDRRDMSG